MTTDTPTADLRPAPGTFDRALGFTRIPGVKLFLIGVLLLFMLIPTTMVSSQIEDRQNRQAEVERGFQQSWGPPQSVVGPLLAVPWRAPGNGRDRAETRGYVYVPSARLQVTAELQPEVRQRGFFRAVVYGAQLRLSGSFEVPELTVRDNPGAELLWQDATVILGATDLRGMRPDGRLSWAGTSLPLSSPGRGSEACGGLSFVRARLPLSGPPTDQPIPFETALDLRGVRSLRVVPQTARLNLTAKAPWPAPSFTGPALPGRSSVSPAGFSAEWDVPGSSGPSATWQSNLADDCRDGTTSIYNTDDQVGIDLLESMPTYRMVDRASKYTLLFLVLCFLTYFLFEVLAGVTVGLVQYGMLGLSVSLFALLLVSFGEPLGFAPAYAVSAALVGVQGTLYTLSVTRRARLAIIFAAVQAGLFGFLYVVLSLETYALLAGSVTLFAILSVLMAVTRRIDFGARPA